MSIAVGICGVGEFARHFIPLFRAHPEVRRAVLRDIDAGKRTVNNVWQAARYLVPGLVAHESARLSGQLLAVPDFGDAAN